MLSTNAGGMSGGNLTPEMHRVTFRGKNLGTSVTAAQLAAIRDGSFKDLFVGDFWVIGGASYRIVDINYWLNRGDQGTGLIDNHLVIMPDDSLYTAQMNATNTTTGGYINSAMRTTNLASAITTINAAFGAANVLTKRQIFVNAVSNGRPSAAAWVDSRVDIPNEINIYGSLIFAPMTDGITFTNNHTIDVSQFALFQIAPKFIACGPRNNDGMATARRLYWLRDVVSASWFASVNSNGDAHMANPSVAYGVRPCFAIG